jgi:hypothetical protein
MFILQEDNRRSTAIMAEILGGPPAVGRKVGTAITQQTRTCEAAMETSAQTCRPRTKSIGVRPRRSRASPAGPLPPRRPVLFPRQPRQSFRTGPDRGQEQSPRCRRKHGSTADLGQRDCGAGHGGSVGRGCVRGQDSPQDRCWPGTPFEFAAARDQDDGSGGATCKVGKALSGGGGPS